METYPDSAITVIDGIDEKQLGGSQERARYALLKSMALDKNYVDTTDFAVLQPAIDHYLRHGSPDQRLRTLFYQGRIFQNRGDNAAAMTCYLQAQDLDHITDTLTLARLLTWQGLIQKSIYDFEGYKNCFLKAARLFDQLDLPEDALDCHLSGLNAAILLNDKAAADSLVYICETASDQLNLPTDYIQRDLFRVCVCRCIGKNHLGLALDDLEIIILLPRGELDKMLRIIHPEFHAYEGARLIEIRIISDVTLLVQGKCIPKGIKVIHIEIGHAVAHILDRPAAAFGGETDILYLIIPVDTLHR